MRAGCCRFRLPVIKREGFRLYKRAKTIASLNCPVAVELVDMEWRCSTALLLLLEAIDVDVLALLILHREDLLKDIDPSVLLLARSTWGWPCAAARLLVGAISSCMAWLVALEAQAL